MTSLTHACACRGKIAKLVLQSTMYINTLEGTFTCCVNSLKACPDQAETAMILLLQVLQDISQWSYKGSCPLSGW